jgi:hypothetical protein
MGSFPPLQLAEECDKQRHKHTQLSQLLSRVQQWIVELRPGTVLEAAAIADVKLNGETLVEAITRVRSEIAALSQQLAIAKRAPLPLQDRKKCAEEFVERQGRSARPTIAVVGDQLRVTWRDDKGETGAPILVDAPGAIECRVTAVVEQGDHHIIVGEVVEAHLNRPLTGRPDAAILEMKDLGDNVFYGG